MRNLRGQFLPLLRVGKHGAHARGEMDGYRKPPALIAWHFGVSITRARNQRLSIAHRFQFQRLAGKNKCITRCQAGQEIFLHLAQHPTAGERPWTPRTGGFARAREAHFEHRRFDNRSDIHGVAGGQPRMGQAAEVGIFAVAAQARKPVITAQGITARADKIENLLECLARQRMIGMGFAYLVINLRGRKRARTSRAENMLCQYIQPAAPKHRTVLFARRHALASRFAFQHLEAIGRHKQSR